MIPTVLFFVSLAIHLTAAIYALLLIRITGWKLAWTAISIAMVLMVSRRAVTFTSLVMEGKTIRFDAPEMIALIISCLLLLGVVRIRVLFLSLYAAEAERKMTTQKIDSLNAELMMKIGQLKAAQDDLVRDITGRKQLEQQLSRRLRHLDVLERTSQISLNNKSVEELLERVLDEILDVFNADRAWFLYPCDPAAPSWSVPMERTRPEWPGAFARGMVIPMTPEVAEVMRETLASTDPHAYGPAASRNIPAAVAEQFSIRSQVQMALHPRVGSPWMMGLHHCAQARAYDEDELLIFKDIGQRVADALSSMIMLENLHESAKQLLAAQEDLVRKEKLATLGQIAGSVGHELRNPLGVMNNAVYFLQTVLSDADETTKEYLDIIREEIAASERIVSDLLDSVRTKPPRPEAVGVAELIGQTLNKLTLPATVTVKLDIPQTLSPLQVDAQQIQQVFRNLISNGVEAMPEGGELEIRAVENKPEGQVVISVRDTGTGIAPQDMARLFQPLFTTKARGIGLGLVVVKNLTEANGGTLAVQSEIGQGTTFTVALPAARSFVEEA
jgi:signal transduction histidine kinase